MKIPILVKHVKAQLGEMYSLIHILKIKGLKSMIHFKKLENPKQEEKQ